MTEKIEYRSPATKRLFWTTDCADPIKAIRWALDHITDAYERSDFLSAWDEGDVADWPKFIEFASQP